MTDSKQAWEVGTANRSPHAKNDWYAVVFDNTKNGKPHHPRTAEVYGMSKIEAAEKARLIAAAPDLLEALQACVSAMAKAIDQTDAGHMLDDQWEAARSAIAKATGGEG
jgi:coenzyme F420-reducing hydrogenase alpha subunit